MHGPTDWTPSPSGRPIKVLPVLNAKQHSNSRDLYGAHSLAGGWQTDDTITLPPWRRQWCIPAGIYTYSGYGSAFAPYHQILPPMPSPSLCRCNLTVLSLGSGPGHLLLPSSVLFCPCSMKWTLVSTQYLCMYYTQFPGNQGSWGHPWEMGHRIQRMSFLSFCHEDSSEMHFPKHLGRSQKEQEHLKELEW